MTKGGVAAVAAGAFAAAVLFGGVMAAAEQTPAPSPTPAPAANAVEAEEEATSPTSPNVRIMFQTVPNKRATVNWGKKRLGIINVKPGKPAPLFIERPRDSGPLDVVVKAQGYLTVHTRANTFSNTKVWVKLTPAEERHKIFGYKAPFPDGGAPDGGAAPDGGTAALPTQLLR